MLVSIRQGKNLSSPVLGMDTLPLLVPASFGASTDDPSRGIQVAAFLKGAWADAMKAQLSEGWRALEARVPSQAKAIRILADTSLEQADATLLASFDEIVRYIASEEKKVAAPYREETVAVLAEMRQALASRQGQIDPSSSEAFALLDQIVGGAPISAGLSAARRKAISLLRDNLRGSSSLQKLTDLYYRLDGTARAVATLLLVGAGGANWVRQNVSLGGGGSLTVSSLPGVSLPTYGTRIDLGTVGVRFGSGELSQLSGSVTQRLGASGLSVTAAADYKRNNPLYASGGIQYATYLPKDVRLTASSSVSSRFLPASTAVSARVETSKALGPRKDLDLSAYAQAQATPGQRPETEAGVRLTQRFGREGRSGRPRANPAVVRRLTGPLPWLQRLFRPRRGEPVVPQPFLSPTSTSPPLSPASTPLPWSWLLGALVVGGAGWWGWRAWSSRSPA